MIVTRVSLDLDGRIVEVTLGELIGEGGEGRIYALSGLEQFCAKIYDEPGRHPLIERRLNDLGELGRGDWHIGDHAESSYPVGICRNDVGACIGFVMHRMSWPRFALPEALRPAGPIRRSGNLTWDHCVAFAADLARLVEKLHDRGVIIGDLCPDNVFVSLVDSRVTLIDVDSFQFESHGRRHHSRVLRADYCAPELVDVGPGTWREASSDLMTMGIVIAEILLEGFHPYGGFPGSIPPGRGDDLDVYCKSEGLSWVADPQRVRAPRLAPESKRLLPPDLLHLMGRCFVDGARDPRQRPAAREWVSALSALAGSLQTCPTNERHRFRAGPRRCPWCDRVRVIDRDPFPPPRTPLAPPRTWLTPAPAPIVTPSVAAVRPETPDRPASADVGGRTRRAEAIAAAAAEQRRIRLDQKRAQVYQALVQSLAEGQVRTGVVTSIANFAVFVDLGGITGVVPTSELSWNYLNHPRDFAQIGQRLELQVLEVDLPLEKVVLSLKATQPDPWPVFIETTSVGQIRAGIVVRLTTFGAYVRLEDDVEGLVHTSELGEGTITDPAQITQVNDVLFVEVTDIEASHRRVLLSLTRATRTLWDAGPDTFDPARYGMTADYDESGNYVYPEGFDPLSNDWLIGHEDAKATWEAQYAEAYTRWQAHRQFASRRWILAGPY